MFAGGSCSLTAFTDAASLELPWWQVALKNSHFISEVVIFNRDMFGKVEYASCMRMVTELVF